jgi:endonuclease YncB( thermonuclease family)
MKNKALTTGLVAIAFTGGRLTQTENLKSVDLDPCLVIPAVVTNVHDIDTMTVEVKQRLQVRLLENYGVELSNENGIAARDILKTKCPEGSDVILRIPYKTDIWKMFTFGRVLGYVYKDGENLSEFAVKSGYATKTKTK